MTEVKPSYRALLAPPEARPRPQFVRDFRAGEYLDLFLVSAVSAVLLIRLFLFAAGYPKVGGDSLHVAHMLWGGLLMLAALLLLLCYLGSRSQQVAALLGGLGFGTFIDEVGKFLTHDNDYFFRPSVALIYVILVLTYVATRWLLRRTPSGRENLVNALHEMENVAFDDLDESERERAFRYLAGSPPNDPLATAIRELLERTAPIPPANPHPLRRLRNAAGRFYRALAAHPRFPHAVIALFVVQLAVKSAYVLIPLTRPGWHAAAAAFPFPAPEAVAHLDVVDWAEIVSVGVSGLFVLAGIVLVPRSWRAALGMFQRSILISIFLTQVLLFYRDQWAALIGLGFHLAVLAALNFAIDQERARATPAATSAGDGAMRAAP